MKALRYLLMVMAVLSVLSVSAQTPKYGKTYNPKNERAAYSVQVNTQMPEATIGSTRSDFMSSGSTLPQAAVTGTSTTLDNPSSGRPGNIRKGLGDDDDDVTVPGDHTDPDATPIGDAALPLALCALAFAIGKWLARTKPLR
ncbi:MAG: hypothetical protein IJ915_03280 [Paludibacteraceae bacterium]|nr:hypothetical protein [Paludibacteraceae bacterium]